MPKSNEERIEELEEKVRMLFKDRNEMMYDIGVAHGMCQGLADVLEVQLKVEEKGLEDGDLPN